MLKAVINAFKIPELRNKILFTLAIVALYRLGCYIPVPGIPFGEVVEGLAAGGTMGLVNMFSGGALAKMGVFALGIMPYITSSIILQLLQGVIPTLERWSKEGEAGQKKITQITRYMTIGLGLISAVGTLAIIHSAPASGGFGVSFDFGPGYPPAWLTNVIVVATLVTGTALIMWLGELITQHGIGNGMSLIIFANIVAAFPSEIFQSFSLSANGIISTAVLLLVMLVVIVAVVVMEKGQRRIPVQYAKRVVGRKVMGGASTYIPLKINGAGVVPVIFSSALLTFPAMLASFFPQVAWLKSLGDLLSTGWLNWIASFFLILFFAYFYTAMVFNPIDTADNLRKQGGFIPGVRPGAATVRYIEKVLNRITLPGAIFLALIAVIPSIVFFFTKNPLAQAIGGTSILIMVGVALETMNQLESQLKMRHYDGFFK